MFLCNVFYKVKSPPSVLSGSGLFSVSNEDLMPSGTVGMIEMTNIIVSAWSDKQYCQVMTEVIAHVHGCKAHGTYGKSFIQMLSVMFIRSDYGDAAHTQTS